MVTFLLVYAAFTVALAFVDMVRIRYATPQKKRNIRKWVSWSLAVLAGIPAYYYPGVEIQLWEAAMIATGVRYLLFDPALNLMRGLPLTYQSDTTNSVIDQVENEFKLSFWVQRAIAAALIIIPFL